MTRAGICEQARHEPCNYCHARPEQPCDTRGHGPGVHLCRPCLAQEDGLITRLDLASVMDDQDVYAGYHLVLDAVAS